MMREQDVVPCAEASGYGVADAACAGYHEDWEGGGVESGAGHLGVG